MIVKNQYTLQKVYAYTFELSNEGQALARYNCLFVLLEQELVCIKGVPIMKYYLLLGGLFFGIMEAKKTKLTVFNRGEETILVSIDLKPWRPLAKSSINEHEAKNFFLPELSVNTPYYFIVESSSDLTPKIFTIRVDAMMGNILLERDHLVLSSMPAVVLNDQEKFIKIAYLGSLRPQMPEVEFIR
jgi:hypothetical protein